MRSIIPVIARTARALGASVAALMLCGITMSTVVAADVPAMYNSSCAACHNSGALGAIKKGDSAAWQQLIQKKGMPTLLKSVKGGMIQMPAGGLCDTCHDDDYRELIEYMSK